MRITGCPSCKSDIFVATAEHEDFVTSCQCSVCGYRDYAYKFFPSDGEGSCRGQFEYDDKFAEAMRHLVENAQHADINALIANISEKYGLSAEVVAQAANILLGSKGAETHYNPLRFARIDPTTVDAAQLLRAIESHQSKLIKEPEPPSSLVSGLQQAIEELQAKVNDLRQENAALLNALRQAQDELDELR